MMQAHYVLEAWISLLRKCLCLRASPYWCISLIVYSCRWFLSRMFLACFWPPSVVAFAIMMHRHLNALPCNTSTCLPSSSVSCFLTSSYALFKLPIIDLLCRSVLHLLLCQHDLSVQMVDHHTHCSSELYLSSHSTLITRLFSPWSLCSRVVKDITTQSIA